MRIFMIVDETVFFHPEFMTDFLTQTQDDVIGVFLVTGVKKKSNIERYIIEHFYYLTIGEIVKLGAKQVQYLLKDKIDRSHPHTVETVLKRGKIQYRKVKYDINTKECIDYIAECKPDVLISSQSLYLGRKILEIPRICCINRHSGLLPRNGGLWPGFQAVRKGETETGVSVHLMTTDIDAGGVLAQKSFKITKGDTLWNIYKKCFALSADTLLEALEKIRMNDFSLINNGYTSEYYSFPTKEHWRQFREHNGRYI